MDIKTFLRAQFNVHESKHGDEVIYIGHDPSKRWSAFFKGKEQDIGTIDTLEEAQVATHRVFDAGKNCSLKLQWKLIPQTEIKDMTK